MALASTWPGFEANPLGLQCTVTNDENDFYASAGPASVDNAQGSILWIYSGTCFTCR